MTLLKTRIQRIWSFVTIIYNLLGLIYLLGLYPHDPFYFDKSGFLGVLTLPIIIVSFAYRFVYSYPLYPIFIIQSIILLFSLLIVNFLTREK
ncbi:hypothetical protein SAMN05444362_10371 [Dysgonomonas macrotermitis]|uniref:Uncharacterized protein n=1 Tax=Dysgonomonas macrotermitis TaxID=1346286 RepID=A0A1M4Y4N5_9BACT|nr:hypothetical protein SAMN05444362_10371 [Dysgonomonas macrotermitis]